MLVKKLVGLALSTVLLAPSVCYADDAEKPKAINLTDLEVRVRKVEDKAVVSTEKKITVGGWVNRAVQWADNGFHSNLSHVSPDNVTSNLQINGVIDPMPGFTVGAHLQIDLGSNGTNGSTGNNTLVDIHKAQTNAQAENSISFRVAEVTFDSSKLGKLSLGRGYMASTGVVYYTDLSGTYVFLHPYSSMGGISFRNKRTGGVFCPNPLFPNSTLKPGVLIFEHGDGGSVYGREDRIRYDSPNFYGFNFSTSHAYQNIGDLFDFALKFAAILAKYTIVAQTSWSRNDTQDQYQGLNLQTNGYTVAQLPGLAANPSIVNTLKGPKFDTYNAAIGILAPFSYSGEDMTGPNVHFSYAKRKWDVVGQEDGRALQGKIGYIDRFWAHGKTAFVASLGQWRAMDVNFYNPRWTMVGTNWGTGVVQNIDPVGTTLYARYDNYKLKSKGSGELFKPVDIVYVGALVKL